MWRLFDYVGRIDVYSSKEVKESIFLAEAREMQVMMKAAEEVQPPPLSPIAHTVSLCLHTGQYQFVCMFLSYLGIARNNRNGSFQRSMFPCVASTIFKVWIKSCWCGFPMTLGILVDLHHLPNIMKSNCCPSVLYSALGDVYSVFHPCRMCIWVKEDNVIIIIRSRVPGYGDRVLDIRLQCSRSFHKLLLVTSVQLRPLLSKSCFTWSLHLVLGLPIGFLPVSSNVNIFLGNLVSCTLITCPNHLILLPSKTSCNFFNF